MHRGSPQINTEFLPRQTLLKKKLQSKQRTPPEKS